MPDGYRTINGPNGPVNFPSSMSDADIEKAMGKLYPAPETSPEAMEKKATAQASEESKAPLKNAKFVSPLTGKQQNINPADPDYQTMGEPGEYTGVPMTPAKEAETAGETATALGLVANPAATARGLIGSVGGAAIGGGIGREVGSFISPDAGRIGGEVGALGGGLIGGFAGANGDIPSAARRWMPRSLIPNADQEAVGAFMNRGYKSMIPSVEEPEPTIDYEQNRKLNLKALARGGGSQEPAGPASGSLGKVVPKFKQIEAERQAGQIPVMQVPEPNPPAAGEKPGTMYSVPREELGAAAQRRKAGAFDVLRDLGRPMIVIPKEAGYPGPRIPAIEEEETPQLLRRAAD